MTQPPAGPVGVPPVSGAAPARVAPPATDPAPACDAASATGAAPAPGAPAPDFRLTDTHGGPVARADLHGTPALLVFVPFAFSGTCTGEVRELRDHAAEFAAAGVRVLVVSCDPVHALRAWADAEALPFEVLSDFWPHGAAATAFGVFDAERGRALRGSFLLDADGVVRWALVHPAGLARPIEGYRAALGALGPARP